MTQAYLNIEHHDITLADTVTSTTVTLSAGDTTKCVPLITYRAGNTNETDAAADFFECEFLTGPNRLQVERGVGDGPLTIHAIVVEWNTDEVDIQTGTFTILDAQEIDDVTITAVDLAKTWMVSPYQKGSAASPQINNLVRGMTTTTTNLHFARGGGGGGAEINGRWWTIEDTNGGLWDVQRLVDQLADATSEDYTITSVDEDKTFLVGSEQMSGGGNRASNVGVAELFDATTVRYTRPASLRDMELDIFVVELLQTGDSVQRGSLTLGSGTETDTAAVTSVDLDRSFANSPMRPCSATVNVDTYDTALRAQIKLNSSTVVEVSVADDSTISISKWEVVELNEEAVADEPAILFGMNF